jgi:hypothetical protein
MRPFFKEAAHIENIKELTKKGDGGEVIKMLKIDPKAAFDKIKLKKIKIGNQETNYNQIFGDIKETSSPINIYGKLKETNNVRRKMILADFIIDKIENGDNNEKIVIHQFVYFLMKKDPSFRNILLQKKLKEPRIINQIIEGVKSTSNVEERINTMSDESMLFDISYINKSEDFGLTYEETERLESKNYEEKIKIFNDGVSDFGKLTITKKKEHINSTVKFLQDKMNFRDIEINTFRGSNKEYYEGAIDPEKRICIDYFIFKNIVFGLSNDDMISEISSIEKPYISTETAYILSIKNKELFLKLCKERKIKFGETVGEVTFELEKKQEEVLDDDILQIMFEEDFFWNENNFNKINKEKYTNMNDYNIKLLEKKSKDGTLKDYITDNLKNTRVMELIYNILGDSNAKEWLDYVFYQNYLLYTFNIKELIYLKNILDERSNVSPEDIDKYSQLINENLENNIHIFFEENEKKTKRIDLKMKDIINKFEKEKSIINKHQIIEKMQKNPNDQFSEFIKKETGTDANFSNTEINKIIKSEKELINKNDNEIDNLNSKINENNNFLKSNISTSEVNDINSENQNIKDKINEKKEENNNVEKTIYEKQTNIKNEDVSEKDLNIIINNAEMNKKLSSTDVREVKHEFVNNGIIESSELRLNRNETKNNITFKLCNSIYSQIVELRPDLFSEDEKNDAKSLDMRLTSKVQELLKNNTEYKNYILNNQDHIEEMNANPREQIIKLEIINFINSNLDDIINNKKSVDEVLGGFNFSNEFDINEIKNNKKYVMYLIYSINQVYKIVRFNKNIEMIKLKEFSVSETGKLVKNLEEEYDELFRYIYSESEKITDQYIKKYGSLIFNTRRGLINYVFFKVKEFVARYPKLVGLTISTLTLLLILIINQIYENVTEKIKQKILEIAKDLPEDSILKYVIFLVTGNKEKNYIKINSNNNLNKNIEKNITKSENKSLNPVREKILPQKRKLDN